MKIIDNFLDDVDYSNIRDGLVNKTFWGYLPESVDQPEGFVPTVLEDGTQFVSSSTFRHMFIWQGEINSPLNEYMKPFYAKLHKMFGDSLKMRSAFANLLPKTDVRDDWKQTFSIPHVDLNFPKDILDKYDCFTALYYVNDSVGDTMFFREQRMAGDLVATTQVTPDFCISPKPNKMVIWNGNKYHAAPAYVPKTRVVVNFNFLIDKNISVV